MNTVSVTDLPPLWLRDQAYRLRGLKRAAEMADQDGLYGLGCRHVAAAYGDAAELLERAVSAWHRKLDEMERGK